MAANSIVNPVNINIKKRRWSLTFSPFPFSPFSPFSPLLLFSFSPLPLFFFTPELPHQQVEGCGQ
jgi:hypothetical protein